LSACHFVPFVAMCGRNPSRCIGTLFFIPIVSRCRPNKI
jgi:hypothetical protein